MCVQSSLIFLPISAPSFFIKFWLKSMFVIYLLLKMARISFSKSSVIRLFLRLSALMQGRSSTDSNSSFMPERDIDFEWKPDKSIDISMWCGSNDSTFFLELGFPFSGFSGLGSLKASRASLKLRP